ncbi:hypothetical protein [Ruminococcus flavefaciens]|uniref:hypothetical protein n=1 Tax=Ruminococcus flavefaciens TaxID=1265 RepID=UPI00048E16A1|nr:hypothetical protein [Ruminococcus flavefaciens]
MNFTTMLTSLAQISDTENPTIFPFPFPMHIALAVISVIFFSYRFAVQKRPFQLIFAIAVPLSLLLWVSDNKTLFYAIGLIELILILLAIITSIFSKSKKEETAAASADSKTEKADSDEAEDEDEEE